MTIPLEDRYEDVIGKAQRGLGMRDEELALKAGVAVEDVSKAQSGEFHEEAARALATALGLRVAEVVAHGQKKWRAPDVEAMDGFRMFNTAFGSEMTVNAYLVWNPGSTEGAVFDTGTEASGLIGAIRSLGLRIPALFLTHTHADHVAELTPLRRETNAIVRVAHQEASGQAEGIADGAKFRVGGLSIEALHTPGHTPGGMTYFVEGLARPLAIVGDALFAGSMGGANSAWQVALRANRERILSLPPETIICPGHGPLTRVGHEKAHNPFYP
jgi:glyoxylase-like metal-dependent hydrolase (beta-lactamase superfamily II)